VRERTVAGLQAARSRGRRGGRKHKLDVTQRKTLLAMAAQRIPIEQTCAALGISQATYFRYLKAASSSLGVVAGTLAMGAAILS